MVISIFDPLQGTPNYRYQRISQHILHDKQLTLKQRGLLVTLISLPPNWEYSHEGLSKIIPDGISTIKSNFNDLVKMGYIEASQGRNNDGTYLKGRNIQIYPNGRPLDDNPPADVTLTVIPPAETHEKSKINKAKINRISINQSIMEDVVLKDIKQQIEYDAICADYPHSVPLINSLVAIIADVYEAPQRSYLINGSPVSGEKIKIKFRELKMFDVEYVVGSICKIDQKIRHPHSYLISCLYNAATGAELDAIVTANKLGGVNG